MKYFAAALMACFLYGCTKVQHIEFTGTAPDIANGVFTIKDAKNNIVCGVNIHSGKFHAVTTTVQTGYCSVLINSAKRDENYDIYLEDGKYTVIIPREKTGKYPVIVSTSKLQNELSAYHHLADSMLGQVHQTVMDLNKQMHDPGTNLLPTADYNKLAAKLHATQMQELATAANALAVFEDRLPDNGVAPHIMAGMNYEDDPALYYKIYQKFNADAKSSDDGKELGERLTRLVKVLPGQPAPPISGTTPDGKTLDIPAMHKKIILVEFWKAASRKARVNHQQMMQRPLPGFGKELGIISVSFDTERDWWTTSVKDDKITWTQISDLKGDDSPNIESWDIEDVPFYCLLDGKGHIIEYNIPFNFVASAIDDYLKKP